MIIINIINIIKTIIIITITKKKNNNQVFSKVKTNRYFMVFLAFGDNKVNRYSHKMHNIDAHMYLKWSPKIFIL